MMMIEYSHILKVKRFDDWDKKNLKAALVSSKHRA
jgi:hypothetical protein